MSPVRKPQNHSGSFTGKFPSLKMNRMIHFESGVEKDFIYLLEFDERTTSYEEQPLRIEYRIGNKVHTYTPDFQATVGTETWIYECKPEKYVTKSVNQLKFGIAQKWCEEQNWGFQIITPEMMRAGCRLRNIKYLTGFSRFSVRPELIAKIYAFLHTAPSPRLMDVVAKTPEFPSQEIYPALFYLAYHHRLLLPIDTELIAPTSHLQLA
jgi:hypothetical protein